MLSLSAYRLSSILVRKMRVYRKAYQDYTWSNQAKFHHVPILLNFIEQGEGNLDVLDLALSDVNEKDQNNESASNATQKPKKSIAFYMRLFSH